jgi:MscS family membrane protein
MDEMIEFGEALGAYVPLDWWTILQIFAVVLITAVVDLLVRHAFIVFERRAQETERVWDDALSDSARRPARIAVWVIGISLAIELIHEDVRIALFDPVPELRLMIIVVLLAWALIRMVRHVEQNLVRRWQIEGEPVDRTTVDALSKLVRISIIITAGLIVLQTLGVPITGVLAFGGIGGLAVGFAAQDLLSNFFGGLTIYLERPFKVGDWVRSPDRDIEGTVEEIGWRRTVIRTFDSRPLYVPNRIFNQVSLENPSRMRHRRIFETVGVRYADFAHIENIVREVREMIDAHQDIAHDMIKMVYFDAYAESSLDFFIYCFTETRAWSEFHAVKEDVLLKVGHLIQSHGAEIAFPTRTLHVPDELRLRSGAASPGGEPHGASA